MGQRLLSRSRITDLYVCVCVCVLVIRYIWKQIESSETDLRRWCFVTLSLRIFCCFYICSDFWLSFGPFAIYVSLAFNLRYCIITERRAIYGNVLFSGFAFRNALSNHSFRALQNTFLHCSVTTNTLVEIVQSVEQYISTSSPKWLHLKWFRCLVKVECFSDKLNIHGNG